MSYRNKTYVIFDGDSDMWAYAYMKGWHENDRIDFSFYDAHDIKALTALASEETIKARLRERMANAKQVIVLVGENTKNLYRFVRWEIDLAVRKNLPIIVVNLNNHRQMDTERCPPILRDHCAIHVAFKMKIIKFALDGFPEWFETEGHKTSGWRCYQDHVYAQLGL